jgi:hypothetical protein
MLPWRTISAAEAIGPACLQPRDPGQGTPRVAGRSCLPWKIAMSSRARIYRTALLVWLVLFALAFMNGALREIVLAPRLGAAALPLSGLTALLAFAVTIFLFVRHARPTLRAAVAIGLVWLILTLAVEILMTLATGKAASEVAAMFTRHALAGGNLFGALVAFTAIAPALFAWAMAQPGVRRGRNDE